MFGAYLPCHARGVSIPCANCFRSFSVGRALATAWKPPTAIPDTSNNAAVSREDIDLGAAGEQFECRLSVTFSAAFAVPRARSVRLRYGFGVLRTNLVVAEARCEA